MLRWEGGQDSAVHRAQRRDFKAPSVLLAASPALGEGGKNCIQIWVWWEKVGSWKKEDWHLTLASKLSQESLRCVLQPRAVN